MIINTGYQSELFNRVLDAAILSRFGGADLKLKTYSWPIRFWRWLLRKEPEYIYPPLPISKGDKIKFKRRCQRN